MDTIRLRTLSKKSTIGFGKYADYTVNGLLGLNKTTLLRWYYFNCDMISFLPEILEEIHIPEEYRIDKPGKCPEKYDELNQILWKKFCGKSKLKKKMHATKVLMGKFKHNRIKENIKYSKASLQRRNHGH